MPSKKITGQKRLFAIYKDTKGNPILHPSYVVFADLLGTRDSLRESTHSQQLRTLRDNVRTFKEADEYIADPKGHTSLVRYFSDCVSIVTPVQPSNTDPTCEESFGFTIPSLMRWQSAMVRRGLFVRGGVAFGEVYTDETTLFGAAHLSAYALETSRAVNPRIILDERALRLATNQMKCYSRKIRTPHEVELLVDEDNEVFLNYLDVYREEECVELNPGLAEHLLENHRNVVAIELGKPHSDHVRQKYEWVAKYHNWFCDQNWSQYFSTQKYKLAGPSAEYRNFRK